jgi:hypothetical protein
MLQIIHWNYRPDDCREYDPLYQGRPADQLLHHHVLLVRADSHSVHGLTKRRWTNQEGNRCRRNLCLLGRWKCNW